MALPLGKIAILCGAGVIGAVLAKDGGGSTVSNFFTGAVKVAFKQLKRDDKTTETSSKPRYDSLLQQVNSLRQELDLFASNRSLTIVTGDRSGSGKYGIIVIVVVVGYGYVWWKGWRLPDMMFATRRALNDACASVAGKLDTVYSSISTTKKDLSSRMGHLDDKIDECAENTSATKEEVSGVRTEVKKIDEEVQKFHYEVRNLNARVTRMTVKQDETVGLVMSLVYAVQKWVRQIEQTTSRDVHELPQASPSRATSLPPIPSPEPSSPSTSSESLRKQASFGPSTSQNTASAPGRKDFTGTSGGVGVSGLSASLDTDVGPAPEDINNNNVGTSGLGRKFSASSILSRTRSVTRSFMS